MDKNTMIYTIMNIFDENERLKQENAKLKELNNVDNKTVFVDPAHVHLEGIVKKYAFKNVFDTYRLDRIDLNPTDAYDIKIDTVITFEQWLNKIGVDHLERSSILQELSVNQVKEYFKDELRKYYEERRDEYIKEHAKKVELSLKNNNGDCEGLD